MKYIFATETLTSGETILYIFDENNQKTGDVETIRINIPFFRI